MVTQGPHLLACTGVERPQLYCPVPFTNISLASEGALPPASYYLFSKDSTVHMRGAQVTQKVSVMLKALSQMLIITVICYFTEL